VVLCTCGDNCDGSSVSAGVTDEVDLRGGMVVVVDWTLYPFFSGWLSLCT
jgi:hypothetical protein